MTRYYFAGNAHLKGKIKGRDFDKTISVGVPMGKRIGEIEPAPILGAYPIKFGWGLKGILELEGPDLDKQGKPIPGTASQLTGGIYTIEEAEV